MVIERNIASDRKGKEYKRSNFKSKKNKQRQKKVLAVQKLYETCKEAFADCGPGIVPSSENVERLKAVLDGMTEADVGLRQNMTILMNTSNDQVPQITYLNLYECAKFSIGIFCLPPTSVIPLHNHPGMTVFSKLLFGTMHIKSYDWLDNGTVETVNINPSLDNAGLLEGVRLAKNKVNSEFTAPCNTSILYPADGGNMHCFRARTPCAVLDVLGPPYCDPEGRHCQYYFDFPWANFSVDGVSVLEEDRNKYAWLKERDKPENVTMVAAKYDGPKIIAK